MRRAARQDQAGAALVGEVAPQPLHRHEQPLVKAGEQLDVNSIMKANIVRLIGGCGGSAYRVLAADVMTPAVTSCRLTCAIA